jgi:hypothetical protein
MSRQIRAEEVHSLIGTVVGWDVVKFGRRVKTWGIIVSMSPDGMYVGVGRAKGKRAQSWRGILTLKARTQFGQKCIDHYVATRISPENLTLEIPDAPTIEVEGDAGRRRIKSEEL